MNKNRDYNSCKTNLNIEQAKLTYILIIRFTYYLLGAYDLYNVEYMLGKLALAFHKLNLLSF